MVRSARTAVRSFVALAVAGLWIAFSGWMPVQPLVEERERTSASAGLQIEGTVASEQRKRGESKEGPRDDAADASPHASAPILFSSRAISPSSARTDAVPSAELRSTRARGPPTSHA